MDKTPRARKIAYSFRLPYCILLPDGDYDIKTDNEEMIVIHLKKKIPESFDERVGARSLTSNDGIGVKAFLIMDFDEGGLMKEILVEEMRNFQHSCRVYAKIFEDGKKEYFKEDVYWNSEISRDRLGRFRYSIAEVAVPYDEVRGAHFESAIEALNRLIDIYRVVSRDSYVERVREEDLIYFQNKWEGETGSGSSGPTTHKFRKDVSSEAYELIRKILSENLELPIALQFIADARNLIEKGQYAMAVVNAIIALENALKVYLEESLEKRNISKSKAKDLFEQLGTKFSIHPFANILEPGLFSEELTHKLIDANELRNRVIHSASLKVKQGEAEKALDAVEDAVFVLRRADKPNSRT